MFSCGNELNKSSNSMYDGSSSFFKWVSRDLLMGVKGCHRMIEQMCFEEQIRSNRGDVTKHATSCVLQESDNK